MPKRLLLATALLLALAPLRADCAPSGSLLDHLIGTWVLRGRIGHKAVVHDVNCRWTLNREYVEMHEVSRERRPDGTPVYEAIVYFGQDSRSGEYAALWLDNTAYGAFAPAGTGHARAAGDSIPFRFGEASNSRIYNTFTYDRSTSAWESRIDNERGGIRSPFARVRLTRT